MLFISIISILSIIISIMMASFPLLAKGKGKTKIPCDPEKEKKFLGKKSLSEMLDKLASSPAPTELKMGAKCYDTSMSSNKIDFICPVCKKKTAYKSYQLESLEEMKRIVQNLSQKLDLELDYQSYCGHCNEHPSQRVLLSVKLHDTCEMITTAPSMEMLLVLQALLDGKDRIDLGMDGEKSVKSYEEQIRNIVIGE